MVAAAAALAWVPASAAGVSGCDRGYRRQGAIFDYALRREWAVYASCAHPEAPRVAVALDRNDDRNEGRNESRAGAPGRGAAAESAAFAPPPPPVVRSGARVRLWRRSATASVELAATALEDGAAGAAIRVRTADGGAILRGRVRAPGSVELEAGGPGFESGFQGGGR
jgi:hypothetical protein